MTALPHVTDHTRADGDPTLDALIHRTAMAKHAMRRLNERHGKTVTFPAYWQLCAQCEDGSAPPIREAFSGGTIHYLTVSGSPVYAVYRSAERAIATFLPPRVPGEFKRAVRHVYAEAAE